MRILPLTFLLALGACAGHEQGNRLGGSCEECELRIQPLVTLTDEFLDAPATILADGPEYLLSTFSTPYQISVFDSTGVKRQTFGRAGDGPGEFRTIWSLAKGPGDSLHVFDRQTARWTVLDTNGVQGRSTPTAAMVDEAHILPTGQVLMAGSIQTPESFGFPVTLLDSAGRVTRKLTDERIVELSHLTERAHVQVTDTSFWAAYQHEYVIEERDFDGRLLSRISREPEWFNPTPSQPTGRVGSEAELLKDPPKAFTMIRDLRIDDRDLVWVLLSRADPRYQTAARPDGSVDNERWVDSVIEVLAKDGELLLSVLFDKPIGGFLGSNRVWTYREGADGTPRVVVRTIELRGFN